MNCFKTGYKLLVFFFALLIMFESGNGAMVRAEPATASNEPSAVLPEPSDEADDQQITVKSNGVWGGSGTKADPYIISDVADLNLLAIGVNGGNSYSASFFELNQDINLSGVNWAGIGYNTGRFFGGVFDGGGHKIYGLSGRSARTYYGFFGVIIGAAIKNLNIELDGNLSKTGSGLGVLVGYAGTGSAIENCQVDGKGNTVSADVNQAAGLVGTADSDDNEQPVVISNCTVTDVSIYAGNFFSGGFVGETDNFVNIIDCAVNYTSTNTNSAYAYAGGFAGRARGYTAFINCRGYGGNIQGRITGSVYTGGFIGVVHENASIYKCSVICATVRRTYTGAGGSYIGGFAGAIYDNAGIDESYVEDINVSGYNYVGGIAGAIYNSSSVKNSYSSGGRINCANYCGGGFGGVIYNTAELINCYAQTDVVTTSTNSTAANLTGNGGFAGNIADSAALKNCYATGSVSAGGNQYTGAFAGLKYTATSKLTNCYGTGTVTSGSNNARAGGFCGFAPAGNIINCFYDTTTTRMSKGTSNGANSGIFGLSTASAIDFDSYSGGGCLAAWEAAENTGGAAGDSSSYLNPWFVDDGVTYPYLYYQYLGHTKDEVDYNPVDLIYSDGVCVAQKRSDFIVKCSALPLKAKSAKDARAYFPYLESPADSSMYYISDETYTDIPGAVYDPEENAAWSLGSVSKTGIIAYGDVPKAVKSSGRAAWDIDDESTYTFVGDTITYQITVSSDHTEAEFTDVVLEDHLPKGVRFIENSVKLISGNGSTAVETPVSAGNSSIRPSYSYDKSTHVLSVYLEDLDNSSYTLTFDVYVEKEAASRFDDDRVTYEGDIRNYGLMTCKQRFSDTEHSMDIEIPFDDNNYDPVYDVFLFEFLKTDTDGNGIEGAEFALYYWNGIANKTPTAGNELVTDNNIITDTAGEGWILYDTASSDSSGLVSGFQLKHYPGCYQLVETSAPPGFNTPACQWLATLSGDAAGIDINTQNAPDSPEQPIADFIIKKDQVSEILHYQLMNARECGSITIEKYGNNDEPLPGAAFDIARWDESSGSWINIKYDSESETWYDDIDGGYYSQETIQEADGLTARTVFANLPVGSYMSNEVTAPEGYSPLLNGIEAAIPTEEEGKSVYDITLKVYDNAIQEMPESGPGILPEHMILTGFVILVLVTTKIREKYIY